MSETEIAPEVKTVETAAEVPVKRLPSWKTKKRTVASHRKPVTASKPEATGPTAAISRPDRSKPQRVKFADRNRISFDGMEQGFVYRAVNDIPGRIQKMQSIGYELVESDQQLGDYRVAEGSKLGRAVSKAVGGGINAYLMRTRKEFYDEDQAAKAEKINALEAAVKPVAKDEYGPGVVVTATT